MTTFDDFKTFFSKSNIKLVIAADAEPRTHKKKNSHIIEEIPGGGVGVALDAISLATRAVYVARGKSPKEKFVLDARGKVVIKDERGNYTLKRLFFNKDQIDSYYNGFSNQTLWPLCHVAFERPEFKEEWFEGYKKVNERFASAIKDEIKGKTLVWIHDYQLALVPSLLGKNKDSTLAFFWHIPWPTWEAFRILPNKTEILESLLTCNFLAFHRGYHVSNFLETVRRELAVRIDEETNTIYLNNHKTTVRNIPLGIDTQSIKTILKEESKPSFPINLVNKILSSNKSSQAQVKDEKILDIFDHYKVILGVDRLDYTKGLLLRLKALDRFFAKNRQYIGKVVYVGVMAPSREEIPAYKQFKKDVVSLAYAINQKYANKNWKPIVLLQEVFSRKEIVDFYQKADCCLVTPRDDGMNLVSKEFVVASSISDNPGMLVLSRFAGSAIDLTESLIINPYNIEEVAQAVKKALEMNKKEKIQRIRAMANVLEEKNVYEWGEEFIRGALLASKS